MKYRMLRMNISLGLMLLLQGCLDLTVKTVINSDGSSERAITVDCGSKKIPEGLYPWASDSSWSIEWKDMPGKPGQYSCTVRKKFPDPGSLVSEYSSRPDTGIIGDSVNLTRSFQWFYSYFHYRETYVMHNRSVVVPATLFLTPDEIERVVRGDKSDTLSDKVKMWDSRNMSEIIFRLMLDETARMNDASLTPAALSLHRDEIIGLMMASDTAAPAPDAKKDTSSSANRDLLKISAQLKGVLHSSAVDALMPAVERAIDSLMKNEPHHPDTWTSAVQMPGLLLATNSTAVEGNTVSWKFESRQIHVGAYAMTAESRVTNYWAFIVTAAALVLLFVISFRASRRRRFSPR
jgi:hypothetical protein